MSGHDSPGERTAAADPAIVRAVELMFFAYRDFTKEPDQILESYGFGRAHHRVLHFVNRYPGLRVADLLKILQITKQSLSRVLNELTRQGFIDRRPGKADRRERILHTTAAGSELARRLMEPQIALLERALPDIGGGGSALIEAFLTAMIRPEERGQVLELVNRRNTGKPSGSR